MSFIISTGGRRVLGLNRLEVIFLISAGIKWSCRNVSNAKKMVESYIHVVKAIHISHLPPSIFHLPLSISNPFLYTVDFILAPYQDFFYIRTRHVLREICCLQSTSKFESISKFLFCELFQELILSQKLLK